MGNPFPRYTEPLVDLSNRARAAYVRDNRNGRIAAISIGFLFPVPREGVVSESKGK